MEAQIARLLRGEALNRSGYAELIRQYETIDTAPLFAAARKGATAHYGHSIFLRGLIEISNHCVNDCYYCGIRCSNQNVQRYRLSLQQILRCCEEGYALGLRTFVLQGGEDGWFTDERLCGFIREIKSRWPDVAVTLSLGERSKDSYRLLKEAGADRYLLRHETANEAHYRILHPPTLTLTHRQQCLRDLKQLGFQVGAGFMIGSPGQTPETLADDLLFLAQLRPQMVGIGPFIPHHDTPFKDQHAGSAELTLFMLALTRLLLPGVLLPATTALGTVIGDGWERGVLAGANVIMPNLTPEQERANYLLYDNKDGTTAREHTLITARMAAIGYQTVVSRGDACGL